MTRITSADVRKVANLARLNLPEKSIDRYTGQLEKILEYIAQLEKIDTTDVEPTTRAVEVVNISREDSVTPTPVREQILDLAPQREGDFFRVPRILSDK
ncbi:Asp-tRNA(Asn)/Glu-tRNA(Gln) amidotransferase subunit GatC [Prochlorococcus sp. MIT 1300]|uniref:Asp-tRNA(Asn)/Glu-tRNA(Gln) amidotransferase subunit GatC n=1 Tax=Prochlorococcus sp. MIT 1300 TaxID=3096218 RepID=UPI002A75C5DF|nr:Asp-tRNA(Asn)/Glu-tRNA(Gln) amidotransferase subunit GatC [Prochlorococcus sp. MIT 1300]